MLTSLEYDLRKYLLESKWVGRSFRTLCDSEVFTITGVIVDRRRGKAGRRMDRLVDDYGSIWFISEMESPGIVEVDNE
jgi:hypothetical protein